MIGRTKSVMTGCEVAFPGSPVRGAGMQKWRFFFHVISIYLCINEFSINQKSIYFPMHNTLYCFDGPVTTTKIDSWYAILLCYVGLF